jgi:dUTP pyrophosphatase
MNLLVKRLTQTAQIPKRSTEHSSCFDLHADQDASLPPGGFGMVGTGIAVSVPPGYEVQVRSRSGHAAKRGVFVLNSPGTVDADYRGEVKVILANLGGAPFVVAKGDRIAQIGVYPVVMCPALEVEELEPTARGGGGLGHTGI